MLGKLAGCSPVGLRQDIGAGWDNELSQGRCSAAVPDEEEDDEQEAREVEEGRLDRGRGFVSLDAIRLLVGLRGESLPSCVLDLRVVDVQTDGVRVAWSWGIPSL